MLNVDRDQPRATLRVAGYATVIATVLLSALGHLNTLRFLRTNDLLASAESSGAGFLGAILSSQISTAAIWILASVGIGLALRVWTSDSKCSFADLLAIVGYAHLPLALWAIGVAAVVNVGLSVLYAEAAVQRWPPDVVEGQFLDLYGRIFIAKLIAYGCAAYLCVRLVQRAEGLAFRTSVGIVAAGCCFAWLGGRFV